MLAKWWSYNESAVAHSTHCLSLTVNMPDELI